LIEFNTIQNNRVESRLIFRRCRVSI